MIIPQAYPIGAIAPDGREFLIIGWEWDGCSLPRAVLAGHDRAVALGVDGQPGWRWTQDVPIPRRPELEDWTEVRLCGTEGCSLHGMLHAGRCDA